MAFGEQADEVGCGSARYSSDVVDEAHGCGSDGGGKKFGGDDREAREVAGAEEAYDGADDEEQPRVGDRSEDRDCGRGDKEVGDVGALGAEAFGDASKADVAGEGADLHHDGPGSGVDDREAVTAVRDGQGQKARRPGEEPPPGEERGRVHGGADQRGARERSAEELQWRRIGLALVLEELGLGDAAADPEGEKRGEDAGEEDGSPTETWEDECGDGGAQSVANGPEALHEGEGFAAGGWGEGFGDEGGPGCPLAAHAEAKQDAKGGEDERGLREAAEECRDGVNEETGVEGAGASEAISEPTEVDAAGSGREQRCGHHGAGDGRREMEVTLHGRENHGVQHDVHAVEHPAECGGYESPALDGGCGG